MKQRRLVKFTVRWLVCGLGLWIAASLLGPDRLNVGDSWATVAGAGFFLAVINTFVKPLLVFLSIPAILISLGLFMLVVAIVAGVIVGLVNYLVTRILEDI
jgi:putative membrane protein